MIEEVGAEQISDLLLAHRQMTALTLGMSKVMAKAPRRARWFPARKAGIRPMAGADELLRQAGPPWRC